MYTEVEEDDRFPAIYFCPASGRTDCLSLYICSPNIETRPVHFLVVELGNYLANLSPFFLYSLFSRQFFAENFRECLEKIESNALCIALYIAIYTITTDVVT